ncbi:MAG TPA: YceH family protein [Acidobacteriaceae bacterium]|nr:YceH family protein [Acidobacteriaceae bacterium]
MTLDSVQTRVLGALIEKEIVTPENYPLSLNALVNACNQKSSRDPVMDLSEEQVQQALHTLEDLGLTATVRDSRVAKFEHRARTVFQLRRDETAVLCLLLLRGAQTPGELRSRCERMYAFDDIDAVESTLARLTAAPEAIDAQQPSTQPLRPLIAQLTRQPGSREARFADLLGGPVETAASTRTSPAAASPRGDAQVHVAADILDRIAKLEAEVAELREALAGLTH